MHKQFIKDLLIYMPSKFLPAVSGLITTPILTRLFLPAEYGDWALAVGVSEFLFAFACSGIGAGAVRFFPSYKARAELGVFFASLFAATSLAIGVVGIISFSMIFFLRAYIPRNLYSLLLISILIFIVQSIYAIFAEVARAQNRSTLYTWLGLFVNYGSLGIGLVLIFAFGFRVEGLMLGTLVVVIFAIPFLLRKIIQGVTLNAQSFRITNIQTLWHYAWPLSLGNIAFWGLRLSDRFVIGFFRPGVEVGMYSAVYNLSDKTINLLVALFLLSMGPLVNTVWEEQGRDAAEKTTTMITRLFLLVCVPATVGLSILAFPFIAILTGPAYHDGYRIVGYVAFSSLAYGLSQIASRGMLVGMAARRIAVNQILAALVNLGLNLVLVPRFGYVAAGVTTLIGYALLLVLQTIGSHPYLTWHFPYKTLWNVSIASVFMGLSASAIYALLPEKSVVHIGYLTASIIVAVLVYLGSVLIFGEITHDEKAAAWYYLQNKAAQTLLRPFGWKK